jgi:ABC-type oligopeptide transport system substrate-binding subunit
MKRKVALLMSLILVFSMVLTACSGAKKPDMLVVHVGPDPDTIDPALNSAVDGATLISHAFEGLMILDKDGVPREGQAKATKSAMTERPIRSLCATDLNGATASRSRQAISFMPGTVR